MPQPPCALQIALYDGDIQGGSEEEQAKARVLVENVHSSGIMMGIADKVWRNFIRFDLCVKQTTQLGLGVFNGRRRAIPKDTAVALYFGSILIGGSDFAGHDYAMQLGDSQYIVVGGRRAAPFGDPPEIIAINAGLYNHACDQPNCCTETIQPENCMPFVVVYTARKIRPNEQLRYDYSAGYWTPTPNDKPCRCHPRGCPKRVYKATV
jgi:hypothetical protein